MDRQFTEMLADSPPFHFASEDVACDHSVEIQVPFLQTVLPDAMIVPLYVGRLSPGQRNTAAEVLCAHLDPRTILLASSDLTHFGRDFGYLPFAVDDHTPGRLRALDARILEAAGSLDSVFFLDELGAVRSTTCGREPIALLIEILRRMPGEEIFQETLDYDTSGAMTRDYSLSVSYGAAGYFRASAFEVDTATKADLLAAARSALDHRFGRPSAREEVPPEQGGSRAMAQPGRMFVSIHAGGELRGCVGYNERPIPLAQAVRALAIDAAVNDARFQPVDKDEDVEIEINLLTPPKRIRNAFQFQIGEHGALLKFKDHCAILLPSVAKSYALDRTGFLQALARKAGLPADGYCSDGARLFIFRSQCFSDRLKGET